MKSKLLILLVLSALPGLVEAVEAPLSKAYAELQAGMDLSKERFRYIAGTSFCLNGKGQSGYNEIDYAKRDGECANLRHKKLAGFDFSGFNLRGADLTSASLPGANLQRADLTGATLFVANLSRADLTDAVVDHLDMNSSTLIGAVFLRASIVLTNMKGADMRGADFRQADLRTSDLRYTAVEGADFRGAVYDSWTFLPFNLESARMRGMLRSPGAALAGPACGGFLPPNDLSIAVDSKEDQGLSREQFDAVLDAVEAVYAEEVSARGGRLVVERRWDDPTVNAKAKREEDRYIIQMFGGLARHWTVTQDGFALVACHELGHHLGGWPRKRRLHVFSNEGQADYFANLKCLRRVFVLAGARSFTRLEGNEAVSEAACAASFAGARDRALCVRGALAGVSIARMFQELGREPAEPRLETPDPGRVAATVNTHPATQCRLDTYFQGSLCPRSALIPVDYNDPAPGTCTASQGFVTGLRPRCWYMPPPGEPAPRPGEALSSLLREAKL